MLLLSLWVSGRWPPPLFLHSLEVGVSLYLHDDDTCQLARLPCSSLSSYHAVGTTRGAAALSIVYHGLFAGHLLVHKAAWARFIHPDAPSEINEVFFLASHGIFTLLAAILLMLPVPPPGTADRRKAQ